MTEVETVEEKTLQVDGNRIRYLESGDSERTIVMIHGLGASAERWNKVIPLLSGDFRVVVPDLIGFGYSDKPHANYTLEFFLDFMEKFLAGAGVRRPTLMGASMGGQVAAEFAATRPGCVDRLVLVSPSGLIKEPTPALDAYILASLYPNRENAAGAFEMMQEPDSIDDALIDDFVKRMRLPNAKLAFMSTILGLSSTPLSEADIGRISAPTLIVWGAGDAVIPIQHGYRFVSLMPGCEFFRMEGCGHAPFAEQPEAFAERALEFLNASPPDRRAAQGDPGARTPARAAAARAGSVDLNTG